MLSQGEISAGLKKGVMSALTDKSKVLWTYLRASKDILLVPYGSLFSSKVLLVKDFLVLLLEVLLLEEDLANIIGC